MKIRNYFLILNKTVTLTLLTTLVLALVPIQSVGAIVSAQQPAGLLLDSYPLVADFNGDGLDDVAVFRPATGTWYIRNQGTYVLGQTGDFPILADYNGDGKTEIAVFRPSTGAWYILGKTAIVFGAVGDIPVPADYNGDGKTDIAVFRPSSGTWLIRGQGKLIFGKLGDVPIPADYNGDRKAEIATFCPATRTWSINGKIPFVFGAASDIPIPADYNGDGKIEAAVFRPSTGLWSIRGVGKFVHGQSGDLPLPVYFSSATQAAAAVVRVDGSTLAWNIRGGETFTFNGDTAFSKPGYLQSVFDPAFGSKITRVVADSWGDVCRHHYSLDQAWNADQTVIWINKGCDKFIDGNTYAPLPNLKFPPDSGGEARWHPTDPKAMIYIKNDTLGKWNPFTGANVILHVFSGYSNLFIGPSKGNLSNDGSMIALYSTSSKKAFAYDIVHNIKYPDIDFSTGPVVDSVTISALGKYIIVNVDPDSTKVFDLQGNQIGNWSEYGCPSHYDLTVDQNGDEVAVGVCKTGTDGIIKRRLSDGKITVIFPMGASHTSARNIRRPGWVYVTSPYYAPYLNQILAIKLDGTTFEIIAMIPNDVADYESEVHGSPSPDGTKVIIASNWDITPRPVQSFVVEDFMP
jgi:hypothetical protein